MKQSKKKDQTRKGANIKGSNYNVFGDLITKLRKLQWPNQKNPSGAVSTIHCLQTAVNLTIMEGDVSSDNGAILESMGRVSRLTSLDTVMHAGLPKMLASSGYKSQRRSRTKKKRGRERRGYKNKRDTA